ncbi:hypothetical protein CDIK_0159 [Cucumispora dikerogammari]|nr:hypothetical protein CDIK_0159 [Cucumispora dikerogammari]
MSVSNPSSSDSSSHSNNNQINSPHKSNKRLKSFKTETDLKIYNLRNEINEMYIDLKENIEIPLQTYNTILEKLKQIILLKNTDSGAYYMAALCCDEVYQKLIEYKTDKRDLKLELKYIKLSHDFYACYIRLVPGNKEILELILTQTITLLNEYTEFLDFKEQNLLQQEVLKFLKFLYKINFKKLKMSIKNFSIYLKEIRQNEYIFSYLKFSEKFQMEVKSIEVLIKLAVFDISSVCYKNLESLDIIDDKNLLTFNADSCRYLEKLKAKFQSIETKENIYNLSKKYEEKFDDFNVNIKRTIVSKQLFVLLKYLRRGIFYVSVNKNDPTLHELLSECIIYIFYNFQLENNYIVLKAVNLLFSKQNLYLHNFFNKEWHNLKIIALISYETIEYKLNKTKLQNAQNSDIETSLEIKSQNKNKLKKSLLIFPTDFLLKDYDQSTLNCLITLNDKYLKNEKYESSLNLINFLLLKLINISNILIRKILFSLLKKKAFILKKLCKNISEQISILLKAHALFPEDVRINIQLSELYSEVGEHILAQNFMLKSNKQTKLKDDIPEGDLTELIIKLKEMFPKIKEIYNQNIIGKFTDFSLFNKYLMISKYLIRMIFRCKDVKKKTNRSSIDRKFLDIHISDWINVIDTHVACNVYLFEIKNLPFFMHHAKAEGTEKKEIEGTKLIYDSIIILDKAFDLGYIRNHNNKIQGVRVILQIMRIISKYNTFLSEGNDLLEMFLCQARKLISLLNDTSILYFIITLLETTRFNKRIIEAKDTLDGLMNANFARHILRILGRQLGIDNENLSQINSNNNSCPSGININNEANQTHIYSNSGYLEGNNESLTHILYNNNKILNINNDLKIRLIEQYLVCCSMYNIYSYSFKKIDDLLIELEKNVTIPYYLSIIFAINCFNHSKSRKVRNRDYTIKRGFDSLFKALENQIKIYNSIKEQSLSLGQEEKTDAELLDKLSIIYILKYNIGRAYHNYSLNGIAEKYYWECRNSPNIHCRASGFINLLVIYEENSNSVMIEKLYAEYFIY